MGRYVRDETGTIFFDGWSEALKLTNKKDELYVVHCRETRITEYGMEYKSSYYMHHFFANPNDESDVKNLQKIVSDLLSDGLNVDEIQLVERTYRTGQTSEGGI